MSQQFLYSPLASPDSIRLIELQPCPDPAASIQCRLIHMSLSSASMQDIFGHYTALSYVWGCADKVKTIWIEGLPLAITESLFSALRDLRDETRPFSLWADGICINQSDNEEKMMQIRIMGKIYIGATNTVLYLGPADPKSGESQCIKAIRDGKTVDDIQVIEHILSKEWFNRVWVFQELVFSNNPWLQCGTTRVKWDRICSVVKEIQIGRLERSQRQKLAVLSRMNTAWEGHRKPSRPDQEYQAQDMLALLRARRGLGVTDPRDMVFAHTGFAANALDKDSNAHLDSCLDADYTKSSAEVYLNVARHIIRENGPQMLLEQIGDRGNSASQIAGLPSWVPDWTTPLTMRRIHYAPVKGHLYRARLPTRGRLIDAILAFAVNSSDTIVSTSAELSLAQIPHGVRQEIASKLSQSNFEYREEKHWHDAKVYLEEIDEVWPQIYEALRQLVSDDDILPSKLLRHGIESPGRTEGSLIPFYLILAFHPKYDVDHLTGRALARTSSRSLAIVPTATRKGDKIVPLFPGAIDSGELLEFVLRPVKFVGNRKDLDKAIVNATWEASFNDQSSNWEKYPVRHCELIGQCIRGNPWVFDDWRIVAIH